MISAEIIGTGSYLGSEPMSNEDVADLPVVKACFSHERAKMSFSDFVVQKTGIEKRYYEPDLSAEEMGAEAAKKALERADMPPSRLDMIIACTMTPDAAIPCPAITIGHFLGVDSGFISKREDQACASFISGLSTAYSYIVSGQAKTALVVAADKMSDCIDFSDPKSAGLFGDGAGAVVLRKSETTRGIFSPPFLGSDYSLNIYQITKNSTIPLFFPEGDMKRDNLMHLEGGKWILKNAVGAMARAMNSALDIAGLSIKDISVLCPHQANIYIISELAKVLGFPEHKTINIVSHIGNISSASGPYALDQYIKANIPNLKPEPGQIIGMPMVGGGYVSGAAVIRL